MRPEAELIVALDVPSAAAVPALLDRLPPDAAWFKVGLELFCAEGPSCLAPLRERGRHVFLDLKLHDIPRTVGRAVRSAAAHGAELLTVHAFGGRAMLEAAAGAARALGANRPRLVAVTVLTSLDAGDLAELGIAAGPADQARALARMAVDAGIDGVVCSAREAASLRDALGPEALIVTPGLRLPGGEAADQKRVATPADAVRAGATHLVVGRPIVEAPDPAAALRAVRADMAAGRAAPPR